MFRSTMSGNPVDHLIKQVAHLEHINSVASAIAKAQKGDMADLQEMVKAINNEADAKPAAPTPRRS